MKTKLQLACIILLMFVLKTYAIPPVITSFSPSSGAPGTLVTINGTDLGNATNVVIGNKPAIIISNTATKLVCMVMPGTVTGSVTATNVGGSASGANFVIHSTPFPTTQQGVKLVGTNNNGSSAQGTSVAVSADGNTAIVGGPLDGNQTGAAWIFVRNGSTWTQQGGKLTGSGKIGSANFGNAVAINADGNSVAISGFLDNNGQGAIWVYTRTAGTWTQQGNKLTGTGTTGANLGLSVAISADGNTIITGGGADNNQIGALWVFARSGNIWAQQGSKLTAAGTVGKAQLGFAVAISADGNIAIGGGYTDNGGVGASWIFTRTGTTWTQQGSKLIGTGVSTIAYQGNAVALNANGNIAVIGGYGDNNGQGAIWVFERNGSNWSQQGTKLVGTNNTSGANQGTSVAISADGNSIIEGGPTNNYAYGAAWSFTRLGTTWTQQSMFIGSGAIGVVGEGTSVSLSADGSTAFVGGVYDHGGIGASWAFIGYPKPKAQITLAANKIVTYGDIDFSPGAISSNTQVPVVYTASDTSVAIIVNNKVHIKKAGSVIITASQSASQNFDEADQMTQSLTIKKASLTIKVLNASREYGSVNPQFKLSYLGFVNNDDSTKLIKLPTITTSATITSAIDTYPIAVSDALAVNYNITYVNGTLTIVAPPSPVISSFSPTSGTKGTTVTIIGQHFNTTTQVKFGNTIADSVIVVSSTQIKAIVGNGSTGNITVTTKSDSVTHVGFTYVFTLPANNFQLAISNATCKSSNDGRIAITASQKFIYTLTVTANNFHNVSTFITSRTINNLKAGNYHVCITIAEKPGYEQCFEAVVVEPESLSVYSAVNNATNTINLSMTGSQVYHVSLNNVKYETNQSQMTLPLVKGTNELIVIADKECQGIYKKLITVNGVIAYPIPFVNMLNIDLGDQLLAIKSIDIYNTSGKKIYNTRVINEHGKLSINLSSLPIGVYVLRLDNVNNLFKIWKQ